MGSPHIKQLLLNIEKTITISKREYNNLIQENSELKQQLSKALSSIGDLQTEIRLLKNGRKSDTSSTPSSQDFGKGNKNNLREKSEGKSGGQKGHKGSSLKMSGKPDEIQKHAPGYCKQCGEGFNGHSAFELHQRKQEVAIPPVKPRFIEHRSYSCRCSKCNWFWVFQNYLYTFIKVAYSRGCQTIAETFPCGFPMSTYVSDSLPAQLKTNTKAKQLCLAHLMRELKNFENALNCTWSPKLKQLFKDAVSYGKQMTADGYSGANPKVGEFEKQLDQLLEVDPSDKHQKLKAFIKRLIKNRDSIFTFLHHLEAPLTTTVRRGQSGTQK